MPEFLDKLTIVFGRRPHYDIEGKSFDIIIKPPSKFFTIGTDGTREREVDYHRWLEGFQKILDRRSSK